MFEMFKIHNLGIKFLHLLEAPFTEIGTLLFENNYFGLFHVQTFLWMRSCFRGRFLSHHYTVTLKTMTPVANFYIILCEIFYNLSKAFILGVIRQLVWPNFTQFWPPSPLEWTKAVIFHWFYPLSCDSPVDFPHPLLVHVVVKSALTYRNLQ